MITLGSSDSINAGAQTAATVNYVIEGELISTTSSPPQLLGFSTLAKGQLLASVAQLFSPGTNTQALVSRVAFYNTSPTASQAVTVAEGGTTSSSTIATMTIPALGWAEYEPSQGWTVYNSTGVPLATGGTGGGVTSVNTRTGAVVLTAADVAGGASGTSGQVLQTDGSGHGSWATPASGGVSSVNGRTGAVALQAADVVGGASGALGQHLTATGSGAGTWEPPGFYNVANYGILPTNTDNTSALNTLVTNAVTAAQSAGTNYAELFFPPGVYNIIGPTTKGGATLGNAQIPLPVIAAANQKFVLVFRGGKDSATLPHWNQTVGQKAGVAFRTNLVGTNDPTYGEASCIGGPTPAQGYGFTPNDLFDNLNFVMDGISIVSATVNPAFCGVDLRCVAEAHIGTLGCFCDAATSTVLSTAQTNNWTFGLAMPEQDNNDLVTIDSYSVEGWYIGFFIKTEHLVCLRLLCVMCTYGISVSSYGYFGHKRQIIQASTEGCNYHVFFNTGNIGDIHIDCLDTEEYTGTFATSAHIQDTGNQGRGYIGFNSNHEGTNPIVSGALNVKIRNLTRKAAIVQPADVTPMINFPATATPFLNPFWREAMVYLSGGTITDVTVILGQITHSLGASPGPVFLPSGASIQVTYTGTPTWTWIYN